MILGVSSDLQDDRVNNFMILKNICLNSYKVQRSMSISMLVLGIILMLSGIVLLSLMVSVFSPALSITSGVMCVAFGSGLVAFGIAMKLLKKDAFLSESEVVSNLIRAKKLVETGIRQREELENKVSFLQEETSKQIADLQSALKLAEESSLAKELQIQQLKDTVNQCQSEIIGLSETVVCQREKINELSTNLDQAIKNQDRTVNAATSSTTIDDSEGETVEYDVLDASSSSPTPSKKSEDSVNKSAIHKPSLFKIKSIFRKKKK